MILKTALAADVRKCIMSWRRRDHAPFWWTGEYRQRIEYPRASAADCFFQDDTYPFLNLLASARSKQQAPLASVLAHGRGQPRKHGRGPRKGCPLWGGPYGASPGRLRFPEPPPGGWGWSSNSRPRRGHCIARGSHRATPERGRGPRGGKKHTHG